MVPTIIKAWALSTRLLSGIALSYSILSQTSLQTELGNGVSNPESTIPLPQDTLYLELTTTPGGSEDFARDFPLVFGFLFVCPVVATLLFQLCHLLHGHLRVDGS